MKCVHISDSHDVFQSLNMIVPECDILFFTGDLTYRGTDNELEQLLKQFVKLKQRIPHIVGCLGNHEMGAEGNMIEWSQEFKKIGVDLLHHESITIEGIKIFGSPYTPWFYDWAFSYESTEFSKEQQGFPTLTGKEIWEAIPNDTNILLSHGPPKFILDRCRTGNAGCQFLREKIEATPSIKYHLFGHIHEGYGKTTIGNVTYMNSAIMDGKYKFVNDPQTFEIGE